MTSYLLGSNALVEFVLADKSSSDAFKDWVASLTAQDDLFASEISLGEIRWTVEVEMSPLDRDAWRHQLETSIPQRFGANLLSFRGEAVRRWGLIRLLEADGSPLPAEETQIIAQALADDLVLVGPKKAVHALCGVEVFDPLEGSPWP